jgi:hypothetical protein
MSTLRKLTILMSLVMTLVLLAVPALAKDKTVTLIYDDGQTYVCTYIDGERIKVVNQDTGEEILDFDIEDLEDTLEEAMEDVEEALDELEGLDIDLHLGDESFLRMELGDERVFIDMDAMIEGVMDAVASLDDIDFGEIDIDGLHFDSDDRDGHHRVRVVHDRDHDHDHDNATISDELDKLRDEINELKSELRKAKRASRH